jgi:phage shock protein PspC (stress-responsive transcriptional regulator)
MSIGSPRIEGALLAGVCAGTARTFGWNVWVLRALFVVFLLVKSIWAVVVYAVLALGFHLLDGQRPGRSKPTAGLSSPELSRRSERISDLERRFRELEGQDPK